MSSFFERILEWIKRLLGIDDSRDEKEISDDEIPIDRLDLKDDPELISPPILAEPLYQCAIAVTVTSFIPHAEIDIEIDGAIKLTETAEYPIPYGHTFELTDPLISNQELRARQRVNGVESNWSEPVTVRDHTQDYPAGPPRPQVNPAPVHQCGSRTGVNNLLIGCNTWITADGNEVGTVKGASEHQGINVNPDYSLSQKVIAWAELCDDPSPPSISHITQPPPSPLPTPAIETVHEGGEQITIKNLANGARFTIDRDGVNLGTWRTWGQRHLVGLSPPLVQGETITTSQRLCSSEPDSPDGSTTVQPCSSLPAPVVSPVQTGDTRITLIQFVPDARIKVFVNNVKVGESGGPVIQLTTTIKFNDVIHVQQNIGKCIGSTVRVVHAKCIAPPTVSNPSDLNLFPVGYTKYDGEDTIIDGSTYSVSGIVYYPAQDDGEGKEFNKRLSDLGQVPIVFLAHGNHSRYYDPGNRDEESCYNPGDWIEIPNHEGYTYFQEKLARMGIISVSVYSNQTNCVSYSATNMRDRAELIIASIAHFQALNASGDLIFNNKINFSKIGLLGHSRGGEAVVVVPEIITLQNVSINSVISLAPTDAGASSGSPRDYTFMTILPAGDGDVVSNNGARFYDKAEPHPFKCQLYIHKTNHNFFNRQWPEDDSHGPNVISRHAHERILLSYGCAYFRNTLLGHDTLGFLSGKLLPQNVSTENVHISFELDEKINVDNHEDNNGIEYNSLNQQTSQQSGFDSDEYTFAQSPVGTYNQTFFGNSVGMVAECLEQNGVFRSELVSSTNLSDHEIWIRAAEVYNGLNISGTPIGFELGIEDGTGAIGWIDSDYVGGLPRPYDRKADDLNAFGRDFTKTMLKTFRFKVECNVAAKQNLDITDVRAILLRCNRGDRRALAFDDLHVVSR